MTINDPRAVADLLRAAEAHLFAVANRKSVDLTLEWKNSFTEEPGAYVIFDGDKPVYIGEGANLRKRLNNLRQTRQHVLNWHLGRDLFSTRPDYNKANSRTKYSEAIERDLKQEMQKLKVCVMPVSEGRKIVEDYLILKYKPKYNKK